MKLNLGCKTTKLDGFKNVDIYPGPNVDIVCDISKLTIDSESVDEIYASHCLEHFRREDTLDVLKEWYRVLKPKGVLKVAVPDWDAIVNYYKKSGMLNEMLLDLIYGIREEKYNYHYVSFNYANLMYLLSEAGFNDIEKVTNFGYVNDCSTLRDHLYGKSLSLNLVATK